MRVETLTLTGHVPSKKNGKHAWGGRVIIDPEIKALVNGLQTEAELKWRKRPVFEKADIHFEFHVRDGRGDLDGKTTTIQDVLVKAGVLRNDSIARVRKTSQEAFVSPKERVVVTLTEAA